MDGRQRLLQSIDNLYMYLREKVLMNNNQVEIIVTPSRTKDKAPWLPHIMKRPSDNETIYDVQVYLNDRLYVRFSANMFDTKCKLRGIVSRIPQEYFEDKNVGDSIEFEDGRTGIVEDYDDEYLIVRDNNDNINKIKRFNDVPSLSSEYLGTMTNRADHSKHTFNLDNPEQLDKLKEIIIRYGLTANDFTEEDKKNHYFFYKILTNNLRSNSKTGKAEVHYYYSDYLVDLDKLNESSDKEKYANGILLYFDTTIMGVDTVFRLTEKETKESKEHGYIKETLEDFKTFYKEKMSGHDFKKDFEEIINAEDNSIEYNTYSRGDYFKKETNKIEKNAKLYHTAKSPRMDFILERTSLNQESKDKFKDYTDLLDFIKKEKSSSLENMIEKGFTKEELVALKDAVDEIDSEFLLHYYLIDTFYELIDKWNI